MFVSAVSAWEIATKHRLGRLPEAGGLAGDMRGAIVGQGFTELPIGVGYDLVIVSNEERFDRYGVRRLW